MWPHVAGIVLAEPLPGLTKWLAGESSGDNVAGAGGRVEVSHVAMAGHVGESGGEHALAVGVVLDELDGFPSEQQAAEQSAAGSGEEGEFAQITAPLPPTP